MDPLEDPFQRLAVAGGEIHQLPADGLRVKDRVKGESKGSRSQTLLEHAEPQTDHHLAPQGRILPKGRDC
jgi:hypothetical protein